MIRVEEQHVQRPKQSIQVLVSLLILPLVFLSNHLFAFIFARLTGVWEGFAFFVVISLWQSLLLIGGTMYLSLGRWGMTPAGLGLGQQQLMKGLKEGFSSGLLIFALVILGGMMVELFYPISSTDVQLFTEMVLEASSPWQLSVLFIFGVIIAPFAEELYFRGLLFSVLKQYLGLGWGIVTSGIVFGLLHFDLVRLFPLALGGMGLAVLYHKTKSLYASIITHGVWNGLMFAILLLADRV